jgi:hypothetical protein
MEPSAHGPRGDRPPMFGRQLGCQRGTAPAGTTLAIGAGWGLEQRTQRALHYGQQDRRPYGGGELALRIDSEA